MTGTRRVRRINPARRRALTARRPLRDYLLDYIQLTRLNKPIGIFLLLWPMLWALWVASNGKPDPTIFLIFMIGAVVTRSAGCIINDIADRRLDREVKRTRNRPLAAKRISVPEALILFVGLGLVAIGLVAMLNDTARLLAVAAVALLVIYPFTKRFLSVPQLVLGVAFGWAVPMAFAAEAGELTQVTWLMFAVAVVWAVIYDTMYAMVDRDDDLNLGVRSTAILFGEADRFVIAALQITMLFGLALLGSRAALGTWYFASILVASLFMAYQQVLIKDRDREKCFHAFLNNNYVGMTIFAGIALDYIFRVQ